MPNKNFKRNSWESSSTLAERQSITDYIQILYLSKFIMINSLQFQQISKRRQNMVDFADKKYKITFTFPM